MKKKRTRINCMETAIFTSTFRLSQEFNTPLVWLPFHCVCLSAVTVFVSSLFTLFSCQVTNFGFDDFSLAPVKKSLFDLERSNRRDPPQTHLTPPSCRIMRHDEFPSWWRWCFPGWQCPFSPADLKSMTKRLRGPTNRQKWCQMNCWRLWNSW